MGSPAPVTQTFIHRDMTVCIKQLHVPTFKNVHLLMGFMSYKIFLPPVPLGYALTYPSQVSAKAIQQIWNNSSIADNGDIFFTHASNTFVITRDVIVKALRLPEEKSAAVSYSEAEIRVFLA